MNELKKWLERKEILAIKGPRRSGKTTLLNLFMEWMITEKNIKKENITFLTFEDLDIREKFHVNAKELISSLIINKNEEHYFLMDEYHYVKDGGQKLKFLYDTMENVKFIITGSSSLEIDDMSKHLVGRIFMFYLFPLNFGEFLGAKDRRLHEIYISRNNAVKEFLLEGKNFDIKDDIFVDDFSRLFEEFMIFGGYPEVVKSQTDEEKQIILKNTYETYIARDVEGLLRITYEFKFRKLLSLLSSQAGNMINYNELASLCNSNYKEILGFLNILEQTYIIKLLRPFHKNLRTELVKNPKVYLIDTGMRNMMINDFAPLETRSDKGSIAENIIFSQLFSIVKDFYRMNYWRTLAKAEVDFVLNISNNYIPIEVKFQKFKEPAISRSFRSFISAYNPKRAMICTKNLWGEMKINNTIIKFVPVCYL
ncbi:MAG: ATP-binding protein [Candidatus Aenigmarchaeota archaeon]|nr:ATP-binding protein [Candidatus Aenigmarchaeota archaeon]